MQYKQGFVTRFFYYGLLVFWIDKQRYCMVQFIFKHKPQQKLHGIVVGSEAIDAQIKDVLRISIISIRLYKKSLKKYSILFRNRRVSTCAQL